MDDPEMGAHHHHMPRWARILWRRWWELSAQVDHLSAHITSLETQMTDYAQAAADAEAELALIPGLVQQVADLQAAIAANDPAQIQAAADALEAAVQTAQAATNPPAPVDTPPADQPA